MSTPHDPFRGRARRVLLGTIPTRPGVLLQHPAPVREPEPTPVPDPQPEPDEPDGAGGETTPPPDEREQPEPTPATAPAADTTADAGSPSTGELRSQLAQLDRDELVELAGEYEIKTHRVRTSTLLDQLAAAGARPPHGVTRPAS